MDCLQVSNIFSPSDVILWSKFDLTSSVPIVFKPPGCDGWVHRVLRDAGRAVGSVIYQAALRNGDRRLNDRLDLAIGPIWSLSYLGIGRPDII